MSNPQPSEILNKPSLTALSFALRHKELWPEGFGPWDFWEAVRCGMGLAAALWGGVPCTSSMAQMFGISTDAATAFFLDAEVFSEDGWELDPAPEHVADLIDAHLAGRLT